MVMKPREKFRAFVAILLGLVNGTLCMAGEIEATLDRDSVPAGQGALLTLTVTGRPSGNPVIPDIVNFIFQSRGRSQQIRSINGVTTRSITYQYAVGSQVPGDYQIPSISMTVDGEEIGTEVLNLKVLSKNAAQPPAGAAPGNPPSDEDAEPVGEADRFGFLTVQLLTGEREHVYVGEIAPVKIEAWIPAEGQAQVRSGIQPEGKAFTLHNVSEKPDQTTKVRDGKRYIVVTWYGGISATRAGKNPVSLSLDATVAVRDTSAGRRRRPRMGGAFDDPFFDDIFDQMRTPMIQKDVTLASRDEEIEVRLLPEEGKPDGFSGAVGNFILNSSEIPKNWKTGEPQSLEASVKGRGNFALLDDPKLVPSEGWKVYAGKSDFSPGDVASFSGVKDFRFSAVPSKHGSQELALELSYFDPDAGAYKTARGPSQQVEIVGEDIVFKEEPAVAENPPPAEEDQMIGQRMEISGSRSTLAPLVSRPLFAGLLAGSGLLGCAGIALMVLRSRREDPERIANAELEVATREGMRRVEQANAAGDAGEFFEAGRTVLRLRLGALWDRPAEAITSADVKSRLEDGSPVVAFFQESDQRAYSGPATSDDLPKWRSLLEDAMRSLTTNQRAK